LTVAGAEATLRVGFPGEGDMSRLTLIGTLLLLASSAAAAQKCPAIDITLLNKGFAEAAPWRVASGGPAECTFMAKGSSVSLGFNHMVAASPALARASAVEMKNAVKATSAIEPVPALGEDGFAYQPRKDNGQVDRASMFFYGHRGTVGVSGYLNLKDPITPAQRDLAANLIASTLRVATDAKALAKATNCRYLDGELVARLLPTGERSTIVPDANNCVVSADNRVITVAVARNARGWAEAERLLRNEGCTVDVVPGLGTGAGLAHHCSRGIPRAEVVVVNGSRWLRVLYAPPGEPGADDRAALIELARFGATK
jgi:hypothetical protein